MLADGNRIHNESQSRVYRDAEGRVRREVGLDLATPATGNVKRNLVVIIDPVAGKRYMLNPDNKTAREMPMRGPGRAGPRPRRTHEGDGNGPADPGAVPREATGNQGGERTCRRKVYA